MGCGSLRFPNFPRAISFELNVGQARRFYCSGRRNDTPEIGRWAPARRTKREQGEAPSVDRHAPCAEETQSAGAYFFAHAADRAYGLLSAAAPYPAARSRLALFFFPDIGQVQEEDRLPPPIQSPRNMFRRRHPDHLRPWRSEYYRVLGNAVGDSGEAF